MTYIQCDDMHSMRWQAINVMTRIQHNTHSMWWQIFHVMTFIQRDDMHSVRHVFNMTCIQCDDMHSMWCKHSMWWHAFNERCIQYDVHSMCLVQSRHIECTSHSMHVSVRCKVCCCHLRYNSLLMQLNLSKTTHIRDFLLQDILYTWMYYTYTHTHAHSHTHTRIHTHKHALFFRDTQSIFAVCL